MRSRILRVEAHKLNVQRAIIKARRALEAAAAVAALHPSTDKIEDELRCINTELADVLEML